MSRRCSRSQRWLADVAARYGSPVGHGAVRLDCSQARLALDAGCSPGTIQARIRVLERHGLILSRRPLTVRLEPPAPAGAVAGGPASGSSLPGRSEHLHHLLTANAALGEALKSCPSIELFEAQRLVFAALGRSLVGSSDPQDPTGDPYAADTEDQDVTRGSAMYEGPPAPQTRGSAGYDPAKPADPRGIDMGDPRKPAGPRVSLSESVSQETLSVVEKQPDSLTSRDRDPAGPRVGNPRTRGTTATGGAPRPPPKEAVTTASEIDELVRPLVATAERCGLVGITDRSGLHETLGIYSPDAIRHAVSQVSRLTKAGQIRSSPVGWLISAGRRGDIDLFPTAVHPSTPPPRTTPRAEHDPMAEAAEKALARAGPEELAVLDEWIRTANHHARIRDLIFDPARAAMLHTARLEAWAALQEEAS